MHIRYMLMFGYTKINMARRPDTASRTIHPPDISPPDGAPPDVSPPDDSPPG